MIGKAENKDETLNNDPGKNRPQKTRAYISDYKEFFFSLFFFWKTLYSRIT